MAGSEVEIFVGKYLTELRENNAAVFVGAGLSKASGFVDWVGLIEPLARELGLDPREERDLIGVAQFYVNANSGNRHQLNQRVFDAFCDLKKPSDNHAILARLPISTFWTTNYDRLIERALEDGGKRVDTKYTQPQLAITRRGRDAVLYKMHGDIEHPEKAVLTRDDYERYHVSHDAFITALSGDLVEKTFLFLGFSFTDPNLDYVLSRIRVTFSNHQRQHYCVTKRYARGADNTDEDYTTALTRQMLVAQDLMRFNIKTIFVDRYEEVTEILSALERRFRLRSVFISGSAIEFGAWGRDATADFLRRLSAALIKKNLRITTGFGLGVGEAVVTGAVQEIYSTSDRTVADQLIMRPFPIGIADPAQRDATFDRYRTELIAHAGIALFVLGNNPGATGTVLADGLRAEFDLARDHGLFLLPIGATGYLAEVLWKEVMADFDRYFPATVRTAARPFMEALGKPVSAPNDLLKPIVELIDLLTRE